MSKESFLNEFILIDDKSEIDQIFKEGSKFSKPTCFWDKDQNRVYNSILGAYLNSEKTFYIPPPKDADTEDLIKQSRIDQTFEYLFHLSLDRALFFFKSKIIGSDNAGIMFKQPEKIYKIQRRKDIRLPIPFGYTIKVSFKDPLNPNKTMIKNMCDISVGGLSFFIEDEETPLFPEGSILENVTFKIFTHLVKVKIEIKHKVVQNDESNHTTYKVGVAFVDLDAKDQNQISKYVTEESRKYFTKLN